jgi:hypothetical protein
MKKEKQTWYWVTGSEKNGFKIVTKRPRTKHVNEPHRTREGASREIAMYFLNK